GLGWGVPSRVTDERFQARPARQRWSGRYDPMLTVVSDSADRDGSGAARSAASSVIDEIVREGARRMLAEALRAEVEAYIAQFADVRDEKGHRLVVRNGCHESRSVTTSAGAVDVTAPRVNDKRVDPGPRRNGVVGQRVLRSVKSLKVPAYGGGVPRDKH